MAEAQSAEFVRLLYRTCLDREPDSGGFEHYVGMLESGRENWESVAASVMDSPEYRALHGAPHAKRPAIRPRLCFVHIERTAGTSFHDYLAENYGPEEIFPERLWRLHEYPAERFANYRLFSGHYWLPACWRIPADAAFCTFLRAPEERLLSLYRFWRSVRLEAVPATAREVASIRHGLGESLKDPQMAGGFDNVYTRRLQPREAPDVLSAADEQAAVQTLAEFSFIGIREYFALSTLLFAAELEFPLPSFLRHRMNAADLVGIPWHDPIQPVEMTAEAGEHIERLTRHDRTVYQFGVNLFRQRFRERFGLEMPTPVPQTAFAAG